MQEGNDRKQGVSQVSGNCFQIAKRMPVLSKANQSWFRNKKGPEEPKESKPSPNRAVPEYTSVHENNTYTSSGPHPTETDGWQLIKNMWHLPRAYYVPGTIPGTYLIAIIIFMVYQFLSLL